MDAGFRRLAHDFSPVEIEPDPSELPPNDDAVSDTSVSLDGPGELVDEAVEDWIGSVPMPPPA
jgi:hypothetical protein